MRANHQPLLTVLGLCLAVAACGKPTQQASDTKIVGGTAVTASDQIAKSTVALVLPDGNAFCTGSLIAPRLVVTASHCVEGYEESALYVNFGLKAKPGSYTATNLRYATKYIQHEAYNTDAMDAEFATEPPNDIAVLILNKAAPAGYAPVKALTTADPLTVGETLTLAGFGLTHWSRGTSGVLRKAELKLTKTDSVAKEIWFGDTPGKSACMGDSGGPAFVKRNGKLVLVGVTSRGSSHCDSDGIYTDIRYFASWLSGKAAANGL